MAVDPNALSLAQYALFSNAPLIRKVAHSFLEMQGVLVDLPLPIANTLFAAGSRYAGDTLPEVNWTTLNAEPVVVTAVPKPFQEQAYIIRNAVDTDYYLVHDRNQHTDPRGSRLRLFLTAVNYEMNHLFINGNPTSNANGIVGLRHRLDNPTVFGLESELKINGGGVVLTDAGMTAATANKFISLIQQTLDYMGSPDGTGVVLYMNDDLKRRFEQAIRTLGGAGFNTVTDAFDRGVEHFKNAVIRDVGRKKDQSTRIITSTEDAAGVDGASTFTSLYAARMGEDFLTGWQFHSLESAIRDLGLLNSGTIYRTVVDWAVGLYHENTRCLARVYNIKVS